MSSHLELILASGAAGSLLGWSLRLPSGRLLGAVAGAGLATMLLGHTRIPAEASLALQIMAGTMLGASIDSTLISRLRRIGLASVLGLGVVAMVTWLAPSLLLWAGAGLPAKQAAASAAPAGSAVALLISQGEIDPSSVSGLTVARIVSVLLLLPMVVGLRRRSSPGR